MATRVHTDLIPSYKAHRVETAADEQAGVDVEEVPGLEAPQVDMILTALRCAGIATAGAPGCEADDVIGTLAFAEATDPVLVVGDRDLLQVVADDPVPVRVLYVGQGPGESPADGAGRGRRALRVDPTRRHRLCRMSMLRGDPSDGLPGVPDRREDRGETPRRIRQP